MCSNGYIDVGNDMKKQKYKLYSFDFEYEIKTYKHVGVDYGDSVIANKGWIRNFARWFRKHIYNRKDSKYKICNKYEDWEVYVKSKLPMETDHKNYLHWLIEQRRYAEIKIETAKAVLIPFYIVFLSMIDIFFKGQSLDWINILIFIIVIAFISVRILCNYIEILNFWNDWIEIVCSVMQKHIGLQ